MKGFFAASAVLMLLLCLIGCGKGTATDTVSSELNEAYESVEGDGETTTVGIPNPVVASSNEEISEKLGFYFGVPENASEVSFNIIGGDLAEMKFTVNGVEYCARMTAASEFNDISGLYYTPKSEKTVKVGYCEALLKDFSDERYTIEVLMWFDAVPGIMYNVSTLTEGVSDIVAVSSEVFIPMQGDVG